MQNTGFFRIFPQSPGLNHSAETRFPVATLAKTAPLWGPIRDKYSQSLWVMKIAGLTTLGYETSASLGILFFRCSGSLGGESYELCSKVIDRAILQTSLTVRNPTFQLSLADLGCIRIG